MSFSSIHFEYPNGWIDSSSDPLAHQHIRCLETLRTAAENLHIKFETRSSFRMGDFAQRYAPYDTLLISVHSVGVADNVVRLKESYLPELYYFDRTGYSGWAELAYNVDLQKQASNYDLINGVEFVEKLKLEKIRTNSSKYVQPSSEVTKIPFPNDRPYILLALQTSDDLVASLSTITQLELAEELAMKTSELGLNLVIKRHPMCEDVKVGATIDALEKKYGCVFISQSSINSLLVGAKAVVTINSGVGFEGLVMGVPVITAGRSDYSFVTRSISKLEDLQNLSSMIVDSDRGNICSVLRFFVEQYCLTCGDVEKAEKMILKWLMPDYSTMKNMQGYDENILREAQVYVAKLESNRRAALSCREKTLKDYELIELISTLGLKIKEKIFCLLRNS